MLSDAATDEPVVEPPDHEAKLNYTSKYLVQYVLALNSAMKYLTGARFLTSDECSKSIFLNKKRRREKKRRKKKLKRLTEREKEKK